MRLAVEPVLWRLGRSLRFLTRPLCFIQRQVPWACAELGYFRLRSRVACKERQKHYSVEGIGTRPGSTDGFLVQAGRKQNFRPITATCARKPRVTTCLFRGSTNSTAMSRSVGPESVGLRGLCVGDYSPLRSSKHRD